MRARALFLVVLMFGSTVMLPGCFTFVWTQVCFDDDDDGGPILAEEKQDGTWSTIGVWLLFLPIPICLDILTFPIQAPFLDDDDDC